MIKSLSTTRSISLALFYKQLIVNILRKLDNVLATPHIGYVTEDTYKVFYGNTVNASSEWLEKNSLSIAFYNIPLSFILK
jgi:phosphoglycerate dehydrogenase-like enzyme